MILAQDSLTPILIQFETEPSSLKTDLEFQKIYCLGFARLDTFTLFDLGNYFNGPIVSKNLLMKFDSKAVEV